MSYQEELEIANERFKQYVLEAIASLNEDDEFEQYLETLGQMVQDAASRAYGSLNHEHYITTVGVSSDAAVAFAEVKQEDDSEEPDQLGPEVLELFSSDDHPVLVGCTSCYLYMMLPTNNPACLKCNKRVCTVGELENN